MAQISPVAPHSATDADLVARARLRDQEAVRTILRRYNQRLYRVVRAILRHDSEAEDAVQETYLRAFSHLDDFRGEAGLSTWLTRIAINEALGRLRRRRAGPEPVGGEQIMAQIIQFPAAGASHDPERTMAQREIQHLLEHAIDELPEDFRAVLVMRVIEGMSIEETAELLQLQPETVKTRLHRARRLLREHLDKKIGPGLMETFPFAGRRCERLTDAVMKRLGYAS